MAITASGSWFLMPQMPDELVGEVEVPEQLCRTFWGSHGCALERGHEGWEVRHQCGLDSDVDGVCSVVERVLRLDGSEGWQVRYSEGTAEAETLGGPPTGLLGKAYQVVIFGNDVPGGEQGSYDQPKAGGKA